MTMISTRLRHLGTSMPLALLKAGLVISWSSGFASTRLAVDHAPVFLVVFWRCILVSLILLPWAIRPIRRTGPIRRSGWRRLGAKAAIGALAMGGYLAGVAKGIELGEPAGLAALIADLLPIGTALLGAAFFGRYLPGRGWAGLVAGGIGVAIVGQDALASGQIPILAVLLPLGGMAALAIATLWQARLPAGGGPGPLARLCCTRWSLPWSLPVWPARMVVSHRRRHPDSQLRCSGRGFCPASAAMASTGSTSPEARPPGWPRFSI